MDENDPKDAQAGISPAPASEHTPGLLKRLYREERAAWRGHYRRYFKIAARALGLGFVAGFVFFTLWPAQEKRALELVVKALEDIPVEGSPLLLALTLLYHNARASVVAIAAGVVPFVFLPILDPVLNGGVLGLLASVSKHQGLDVPGLFLTQILPHGVFELTAVLYATSLGMYLSAEMGKRAVAAWRRRKGTRTQGTCPHPFQTPGPQAPAGPAAPPEFLETYPQRVAAEPAGVARNIIRSFVLVVLPLLLIAAAVEGFITPHLR
jgi:stage II sporulation protein M